MEDPFPLAALLACVLLAGFFAFLALAKTALGAARRSRVQALAGDGGRYRRRCGALLAFLEAHGDCAVFLNFLFMVTGIGSGVLAGLAFVKPLAAALAAWGMPWPRGAAAVLAAAFLALFAFCAASLGARIGARAPEAAASRVILPLKALLALAAPLRALGRLAGRVLGRALPQAEADPGLEEVKEALIEGEKSGALESGERTMVEGVFYLGDRPVGAFMTHRSEVRWLDIDAGPDEAACAAREAGGRGCFPVAEGALDAVRGAVSSADILLALCAGAWPGLRALMKTPYLIPETMPGLRAFEAFKKAQADCLFVMDEYGGFAGLLTIRDLTEEIVGDIAAPSEEEALLLQDDGTWLADGSVPIDDAARALQIPSLADEAARRGAYHTLAGLILDLAGEIPKTGASFEYAGCLFKVLDMDGNRIDKVRIQLK
ncbi:MAG: hemolysin family protein [Treponema sp.]|jgi:putative hemolysin|nr:hemolysin family protein [Treponema sp.]